MSSASISEAVVDSVVRLQVGQVLRPFTVLESGVSVCVRARVHFPWEPEVWEQGKALGRTLQVKLWRPEMDAFVENQYVCGFAQRGEFV